MAAILLGDRKLTDLKVTELKAELEKRGLPKRGVKSVLLERLKKAILQEELSNVSRFFAPGAFCHVIRTACFFSCGSCFYLDILFQRAGE